MTLGDASEAAAAAAAVAACGSIVDLHLKTQNWSFIGNLALCAGVRATTIFAEIL